MAVKLKNKKLLIWLILFLFIIDRITKYLSFNLPQEGIFYLPSLGFKHYLNTGIAFSIPMPLYILIPIILIIIFSLTWHLVKYYLNSHIAIFPISLIIIGALSNLLDRIDYNGVIDFIDISTFPAFNLADTYITIGVIWLIYLIIKKRI